MKSRQTLEAHMKRLSINWAIMGAFLTLGLTGAILYWLPMKEAESGLKRFARSAAMAHRSELIAGGDVRAAELQIQSEFGQREGEQILLLDPSLKGFVHDLKPTSLSPCNTGEVCRLWGRDKLVYYEPIFFDGERQSLWGYLYVEKRPNYNWPLILSVILAILFGMAVQSAGFYFNLTTAIRSVGSTLAAWAEKLSVDPKNRSNYLSSPFLEITPIESALSGLRAEIDVLESVARKEGVLSTLRSVGHDLLSPVARMKKIVGTGDIKQDGSLVLDRELFQSLNASIQRLSSYGEQLKFMYKRELGEESNQTLVTNVGVEIATIVEELKFDPEVQAKQISLSASLEPHCFALIPRAPFGRLVENLCSNSIKACGVNGQVTIQASRTGDRVILVLNDNGKGIPAHLCEKVFEAGVTSRPNDGAGIGLFVVRQICEQYGGDVVVDSKVGIGTTFTVRFPAAEVRYEIQNSVS